MSGSPQGSNLLVKTVRDIAANVRNALVGGPFGSNLVSADYTETGIPVIRGKNLSGGKYVGGDFAFVSKEKAKSLSANIARPGDIVFTQRGNTVLVGGQVAIVPTGPYPEYIVSQSQMKLTPDADQVNSDFLFSLFQSADFKRYLRTHAIATGVPHINLGILGDYEFLLPSKSTQNRIANIAIALDDKIETNRRMNAVLEEMARAIFRAWFVDFEPVRAKAAGASHFPGMPQEVFDSLPNRLVSSELGETPEGWEVGVYGTVCENIRRSAKPSALDPSTPYIGLQHMPRRSISLHEWDTAANVTSGKAHFEKGDILFGKLRPYFHKVGVSMVEGVCSTDILVLKPKMPDWFGFTLGHASSEELIAYAARSSAGTKMPRTNWKDLAAYEIVIPSIEISKAYSNLLTVQLATIRSNAIENRTLAATRDSLLPKLISGELSVPDSAS